MGCGNCGSGGCSPKGCKGNGGCSTGGCNRFNVHDWLADIPLSDPGKIYPIIELSFNKGSRKEFYKNNTVHHFSKGDLVAVEGFSGYDVGEVSLTGELVKLQMSKRRVKENDESIKKILRPAADNDIQKWKEAKQREKEILVRSRSIARQLNVDMKISEVELQADGKKATFFYTANDRVDFRELIKLFATEHKVKVEMKQIGIRQEAAKVGGIGSCGRELCCSSWLTDFKNVSTAAARYQNLSINQTKLSGQCGRLKCCLNYELDTYMDALQIFPDDAERLETKNGIAFLQKKDIFKNLMWYMYADSSKHYPLTIDRVNEIKALNKKGQKADELGAAEIESFSKKADSEKQLEFVDVVGQISLSSLDKKKKNKPKPNSKNPNNKATNPVNPNSANKPNSTNNRPQNSGNKQNNNQQRNKPQQNNNQPRKQHVIQIPKSSNSVKKTDNDGPDFSITK